jgi:transcriptional regulator with XRE-family HTH domain
MNLQNLGKTIRYKRSKSGLSSAQAALKLNMTPAYYSRLENGKEKPTEEMLKNIARLYELPSSDLKLLEVLAGYGTAASAEGGNTQMKADQINQQATIDFDPPKVPVLFSDSMLISVSENGVVFDFAQKKALSDNQSIVARIGVSSGHARKIHKLLGEQLDKAETMGIQN